MGRAISCRSPLLAPRLLGGTAGNKASSARTSSRTGDAMTTAGRAHDATATARACAEGEAFGAAAPQSARRARRAREARTILRRVRDRPPATCRPRNCRAVPLARRHSRLMAVGSSRDADLKAEHELALQTVRFLGPRDGVSNAQKARIYALYKQAAEGDAPLAAPGRHRVVAHAKWEGWDAVRGTSRDEARRLYVAFVAANFGKQLDVAKGRLRGPSIGRRAMPASTAPARPSCRRRSRGRSRGGAAAAPARWRSCPRGSRACSRRARAARRAASGWPRSRRRSLQPVARARRAGAQAAQDAYGALAGRRQRAAGAGRRGQRLAAAVGAAAGAAQLCDADAAHQARHEARRPRCPRGTPTRSAVPPRAARPPRPRRASGGWSSRSRAAAPLGARGSAEEQASWLNALPTQ